MIKQPREVTSWGNKRISFHCKIKTAVDSGNKFINNKTKGSRIGVSIHFIGGSRQASPLRERLVLEDS